MLLVDLLGPIINTRILRPDHRDTSEAIDYSKTSGKGYAPIPLSLLNLEIADPPMPKEMEFFRAELQARWGRTNG